MTSSSLEVMGDAELRRNMAHFGPLPVLSTENAKEFEEIFIQFAKCFKVRDMLMLSLTWHYTANDLFIRRWMRHSTIAIERWYWRNRETEQLKSLYNKAQYEKQLQAIGQKMSRNPADVAEMAALEKKITNTVAEIDGILAHKTTEIDHNRALHVNAEFQVNLDQLINSATRRRDDAYDLLERYSKGMGRAVQETFDKILDADFEEVGNETKIELETKIEDQPVIAAAPSITHTDDENSDDVEQQNPNESAK
jgi:hypothetical protein